MQAVESNPFLAPGGAKSGPGEREGLRKLGQSFTPTADVELPQVVEQQGYSLIDGRIGRLVSTANAMTTSLVVAEVFGKLHKNVLSAIRSLECSEEFGRLNFEPSSYLNAQGKQQPMVRMTMDGFTFLAMGFTGPLAARFKEAYIAQFNAMEAKIQQDGIAAADLAYRNPPRVKVRHDYGKGAYFTEWVPNPDYVDPPGDPLVAYDEDTYGYFGGR